MGTDPTQADKDLVAKWRRDRFLWGGEEPRPVDDVSLAADIAEARAPLCAAVRALLAALRDLQMRIEDGDLIWPLCLSPAVRAAVEAVRKAMGEEGGT